MDSISGAQAAGVHVGASAILTGIHHTDQVSSASSPCSTRTKTPADVIGLKPRGHTECRCEHMQGETKADRKCVFVCVCGDK